VSLLRFFTGSGKSSGAISSSGNAADVPSKPGFIKIFFGNVAEALNPINFIRYMGKEFQKAGGAIGGGLSSVLMPLLPILIIIVVVAIFANALSKKVV